MNIEFKQNKNHVHVHTAIPRSRDSLSRDKSRDKFLSRDLSRDKILSWYKSRDRILSRDKSRDRFLSRDLSRDKLSRDFCFIENMIFVYMR
jgi:hypothetical protein